MVETWGSLDVYVREVGKHGLYWLKAAVKKQKQKHALMDE